MSQCKDVELGHAPHLGGRNSLQRDSPVSICHKSCPKPKTSAASVPADWTFSAGPSWYITYGIRASSMTPHMLAMHCSPELIASMDVQHLQHSSCCTHTCALERCHSPHAPVILEPCSQSHTSASQSSGRQTDMCQRQSPTHADCSRRQAIWALNVDATNSENHPRWPTPTETAGHTINSSNTG